MLERVEDWSEWAHERVWSVFPYCPVNPWSHVHSPRILYVVHRLLFASASVRVPSTLTTLSTEEHSL